MDVGVRYIWHFIQLLVSWSAHAEALNSSSLGDSLGEGIAKALSSGMMCFL